MIPSHIPPRHRQLLKLVCWCLAFSLATETVRASPQILTPHTLAWQSVPSEQIRDAARQVMEHNDFRSVRRRILEDIPESDADKGFLENALGKMGDSISDFFEWLFSPSTPPARRTTTRSSPSGSVGSSLTFGLSQVLLYLAVIVTLGIIIWLVAMVIKSSDGRNRSLDRSFLHQDEDGIINPAIPPGELAASTYESRALKFAADGDYRSAVRELLLGSMSWIERAGLIRFRKGLTNRDYIRAVWRQSDRRDAYYVTALEFEKVYFGRRDATQEMFENCLQSFRGAFREETSTTAKV